MTSEVSHSLEQLEAALADVQLSDRGGLERRLRRLAERVRRGLPADRGLQKLVDAVAESRARVAERLARPGRIDFPDELPIARRRDEIERAIADHQVVVVCGETGSGKTTQLPKVCLGLGRGARGLIGHTQPRRVAARSVAARIAEELGEPLGGTVAYKVRFADRSGPACRVKLMTDGILLQEMTRDRRLLRYDTLIVDEAHERSLNIDFLLGYLRRLLPERPDLKLIVTSATIDPQRFADHFGGAPVVEVSGRVFPVEVRYRPAQADDRGDDDYTADIVRAVDELDRERRGDILVFLPGERQIRDAERVLTRHVDGGTQILPLYARLAPHEQDRVFAPGPQRRIVLATNVAETSLTVPRIAAVIDTGLARISRYSHRSKIQRLPVERISRASAEQRAGRCGRVRDGVCIRLYGEDDYAQRAQYTDPELLRTNLAGVLLRMELLGLGAIEDFPFVDAPDRRVVKDGYRLLEELQAVDADGITPLGRQMARLSVDPRLARMIVASGEHGCVAELLVIAAALSVPSPRRREAAADGAGDDLDDRRSDLAGLLELWRRFRAQAREVGGNRLRKWCREHGLSYLRMREWQDVHRQLREQATELGLRADRAAADYAAVHRAALSGLLGHIGLRADEAEYDGARGLRFRLSPGSALSARPPKWVVAASIVQTHRPFASLAAAVQPQWIEEAAAHLVRRRYDEPHWHGRSARVMAFESVSLYGLTLRSRRRVPFERVDPPAAREIFIREGLVGEGVAWRGDWVEHNQAVRDALTERAARLRRNDVLPDERLEYAFYAERLSGDCTGKRAFERWRRRAETDDPRVLFMREEDISAAPDAGVDPALFPDALEAAGNRFPLSYVYRPGDPADGVTVTLPVAALVALTAARLEWLVPGLLAEKVTAIIRALPKAVRRRLAPAPDRAQRFVAGHGEAGAGGESLAVVLSRYLSAAAGADVLAGDCGDADLEEHLRMRVRVLDHDGSELASGRDLAELQQRYRGESGRSLAASSGAEGWHRDGLRDWDFGDLPESVTLERGGVALTLYPALVDAGGAAALRVFESPGRAGEELRRGVARLARQRLAQQARALRDGLAGRRDLPLLCRSVGSARDLVDDTVTRAFETVFVPPGEAPPRTAAAFRRRLDAGRSEIVARGEALAGRVLEILQANHAVRRRLSELPAGVGDAAAADVEEQLAALLPPRFVRDTPEAWLHHLPRFLAAAERRLTRLADGGGRRDAQALRDVRAYWQRYLDAREADQGDPELERFRWLVEEYRVSLFAQALGTSCAVSPKRLDAQWRRYATGRGEAARA